MEDTISRTSQDSAADEFVVVTTEPKLHITGNGCASELERKMTEVLNDASCTANSNAPNMATADNSSETADDQMITSDEAPPRDDADSIDASDKPESGNSFNNMNTSTNATAGAGTC